MFDALWNLSFMMFVALCCLLHNDVCRIMTFVTLICLSHYYVCCIMMSVALWRLSHYDVCRLWLLSLIRFNVMSLMTFVAVPDYACFPAPYYYLLLLPFFPLLAKQRIMKNMYQSKRGGGGWGGGNKPSALFFSVQFSELSWCGKNKSPAHPFRPVNRLSWCRKNESPALLFCSNLQAELVREKYKSCPSF